MLIAALLLSSYHLSPFSTGLGLLALQLHDVRFVCSFSVTANKARQSGISSSSSFTSSKDLWKKHSTCTSNLDWPKTNLRFSSVVVIEVLQSERYALVIGRQKGQILLTDIASLYASTRSMVHVLTLNYTARVHFRTLSVVVMPQHTCCACAKLASLLPNTNSAASLDKLVLHLRFPEQLLPLRCSRRTKWHWILTYIFNLQYRSARGMIIMIWPTTGAMLIFLIECCRFTLYSE